MKRETISRALNCLDDSFIIEAEEYRPEAMPEAPERIEKMKTKRIISIAVAAALIMALCVSAYAVFGSRSTGTHVMPEDGEHTSLSELDQVEKTVGYPITAPESFSNGYAFSLLNVRGEAIFNETNEIEKEYYSVHVDYTRPGSPDRYLDLDPIPGTGQPEPDELRTIKGVPVRLNLDHYKVVPENYQKTEEDLSREAGGHYYISFGSETVTEYDIATAGFELDGVEYMLSDMAATEGTLEELARMAAELIAVAKN